MGQTYFALSSSHLSQSGNRQSGRSGSGIDGHGTEGRLGVGRSGNGSPTANRIVTSVSRIGTTTFATPTTVAIAA